MDQSNIIPPEQAWFWTEHWQQMEREAQADIDAGRICRYKSIEEALDDLNDLID